MPDPRVTRISFDGITWRLRAGTVIALVAYTRLHNQDRSDPRLPARLTFRGITESKCYSSLFFLLSRCNVARIISTTIISRRVARSRKYERTECSAFSPLPLEWYFRRGKCVDPRTKEMDGTRWYRVDVGWQGPAWDHQSAP